jgi:hypothetical protein
LAGQGEGEHPSAGGGARLVATMREMPLGGVIYQSTGIAGEPFAFEFTRLFAMPKPTYGKRVGTSSWYFRYVPKAFDHALLTLRYQLVE